MGASQLIAEGTISPEDSALFYHEVVRVKAVIDSNECVCNIYKKDSYSATANIKHIDNACIANIEIYNNNRPITTVCERTYHSSKAFTGQEGSGTVVEHKMLLTKEKGHMRNIHNMEMSTYKGHAIVEVQLVAVLDGIFLWPYFGFKFVDKNHERLIKTTLFISYLAKVHFQGDIEKAKIVAKQCRTFAQMKPYCMMDGREKYTDFLNRSYIRGIKISMYKNVE